MVKKLNLSQTQVKNQKEHYLLMLCYTIKQGHNFGSAIAKNLYISKQVASNWLKKAREEGLIYLINPDSKPKFYKLNGYGEELLDKAGEDLVESYLNCFKGLKSNLSQTKIRGSYERKLVVIKEWLRNHELRVHNLVIGMPVLSPFAFSDVGGKRVPHEIKVARFLKGKGKVYSRAKFDSLWAANKFTADVVDDLTWYSQFKFKGLTITLYRTKIQINCPEAKGTNVISASAKSYARGKLCLKRFVQTQLDKVLPDMAYGHVTDIRDSEVAVGGDVPDSVIDGKKGVGRFTMKLKYGYVKGDKSPGDPEIETNNEVYADQFDNNLKLMPLKNTKDFCERDFFAQTDNIIARQVTLESNQDRLKLMFLKQSEMLNKFIGHELKKEESEVKRELEVLKAKTVPKVYNPPELSDIDRSGYIG